MEGDWMPQGPALPTATQVHPEDTEAPEEEEDTEAETPVTLAPATEEDGAATGATRVPTAETRAPGTAPESGTNAACSSRSPAKPQAIVCCLL